MFGLIKSQLPTAGESNVRQLTPGRLVHLRTVNAFCVQGRHHSFEVFTHQVELVLIVFLAGMTGYFSGWERKDQPTMTGVHVMKAEDVFEKSPISFGVF